MSKAKSLYKASSFSLLTDPLLYIASIITIIFVSFMFFFANKFFNIDSSSTDLNPFFNFLSFITILTIPLFTLRVKSFLTDDSIPFSSGTRFFTLLVSEFSFVFLPQVLLLSIPFSVRIFGNLDFGQLICGYVGIIFYDVSAISVSFLFSLLFSSSSAAALIVSSLFLFIINFIHMIPLYIKINSALSFILQKISFAWHFSSCAKGILDSRDICYYLFSSIISVLFCILLENRRTGKKIKKEQALKLILSVILLATSFSRLYFRMDFTRNKEFSISETTQELLAKIENPLQITYFRSKELKEFYPQTKDVAEYLETYCRNSSNLTVKFETANPDKLSKLKIQGQQIKLQNSTKTEFLTVYSAIQIQYLGNTVIIPFVLSSHGLEYDLDQKISELVFNKKRNLYLISGNGRSFESCNSYLEPWLRSRGFTTKILEDYEIIPILDVLGIDDEVLIIGSSFLTEAQSASIKSAILRGVKTFIATSPYSVNIEEDWNITKNSGDTLIPILNSLGFAYEKGIVQDISCYPITMTTGEGSAAEYVTLNYPQWISILPQTSTNTGITLYWSSPLSLYEGAEPLTVTSESAWIQNEAKTTDIFIENPFIIPKTPKEAGQEEKQFIVAAKKNNLTVISDQYIADSLLLGFISSDTGADFRNFDFITEQLLNLRDENELAMLMSKGHENKKIYKITDSKSFMKAKKAVILTNFAALPMIFLILTYILKRKIKNEITCIFKKR